MIHIITFRGEFGKKAETYPIINAPAGVNPEIVEPFFIRGDNMRYSQVVRDVIASNRPCIIYYPEACLPNNEVAKLTDDIIKCRWDSASYCAIVTVSPTLINRVGRRIYKHNELISVIEVVSISKGKPKKHRYDKKGRLRNWMIGFFDPDDDYEFEL